jgi:hypothetical protein
VKDGVSAPAEGWGLEHALAAWGNYSTDFLVPNSKYKNALFEIGG